jgi:hypothetical protein
MKIRKEKMVGFVQMKESNFGKNAEIRADW